MSWPQSSRWRGRNRYARVGGAALFACLLLFAAAAPAESAVEADLARPNEEAGPTKVRVGLYLVDFYEVIGSDQVFLADVVLQAEWVDPRLAGRWASLHGVALDEVWNPRLQLVNQRGVTPSLPQRVEVDPSGRVRYRQRWWGRFLARMDLMDFPRDEQRFHIEVVSLGYSRDEVDLVVNSESVPSGRAKEFSVTDWDVGPARMEIADLEPVPGVKPLAGVRLLWEGRRILNYYAVQVIFPLVLIVLMGWSAPWLDPSVVTPRVSVSTTTMLTLIAYRFTLGRSVPNLPYLTRFDYFMLASTILVFMVLVLVVAGAFLARQGRVALVHRMDRWARLMFPVVFVAVSVLAGWF